MNILSEAELRASFINCSKGERMKLALPGPLADLRMDELDFLGWRDPKAPDRAYIVIDADSGPVGIAMRAASNSMRSLTKSTMCSMCLTPHSASGVTLFSAPLAGAAGRDGNSAGNYICANLQCSRYLRGTLKSDAIVSMAETVDLNVRIERLHQRLGDFISKIRNG